MFINNASIMSIQRDDDFEIQVVTISLYRYFFEER